MTGKTISALLIAVVVIATVVASLGYLRLQTYEKNLVVATVHDGSPLSSSAFNSALDGLDGLHLTSAHLFAKYGNSVAQTVLGASYQYGQGESINPVLMLQNYREAATRGNPTAALMLGRLYDPYLYTDFDTFNNTTMAEEIHSSSGKLLLTKNSLDAKNWYAKSATYGNVAAEVMLGNLFKKEERMDNNNIALAAGWYQKAAAQGNPIAELNIGQYVYQRLWRKKR